jgi:hypothetical protein
MCRAWHAAEAVSRMPERRKPEREVEKEHRQLTRDQEHEIQAFVLLWIVPAAVALGVITILGAHC